MLPLPRHPGLEIPLIEIKGVGPQIEKALRRRGYRVLGDLAGLMPNRYSDRRGTKPISELVEGEEVLIMGKITAIKEGRFPKTYKRYFELTVDDGTAYIAALWFKFPAHMRATVKKGREALLFGRVGRFRRRLQMVHPEVISFSGGPLPPPEIRPVYPEIESVKPGTMRKIMAEATDRIAVLPPVFPKAWLDENDLVDPTVALVTLHRPPTDRPGPLPRPEESLAWRNLALFELLFLQLSLARSRAARNQRAGHAFPEKSDIARAYVQGLPFRPTRAQIRAMQDIQADMASARPMSRLLQGDVGAGKTIVAFAAAFVAVDGGRQAAIMAPTEILARQHYRTLAPHAERLGVETTLMIGGLTEAEKREAREKASTGRAGIIIGTHALISAGFEFKNLGLAVIDEQHRFGVAQRLALRGKADLPDILVMTATPIPRSLALTLYGDLDLTTMDELPPGRKPVKTRVFNPQTRKQAYQELAREIESGGRAYIVAPRIEAGNGEEEADEPEEYRPASVEEVYEFVSTEALKSSPVGLIHGRMKTEEQRRVMDDFKQGRIRALVATTVIEVGLDVPEASAVLVESAERFGLAQLHQLRGRVGRGDRAAVCLLVSGQEGPPSERLEAMAQSSDGFHLAEVDLKLRGPGDHTGMKQTGLPPLIWARLPRDLKLLLRARDLANTIIEQDPEIRRSEFKLVREIVDRLDLTIQSEAVEAG